MFVLEVTYLAPIETVEPLVEAHMQWVAEGYARGWFQASGRKIPRTGGIILARGERAEIEAFLAEDPFVTGDVAAYAVTEVLFTRTVAGLDGLEG